MAELVIKIGDQGGDQGGDDPARYRDGDVISIFSDHEIRCTHARRICSLSAAGFTAGGLRPSGSLAEKMLSYTRQFRCERVNSVEYIRLNLTAGEEDVVVCDAMDEKLSRLVKGDYGVFGIVGKEVWYGGRTYLDTARMDQVWNAIETDSLLREDDHRLWPIPQENGPENVTLRLPEETRRRLIDKLHRPEPLEIRYFAADRVYRTGSEGSTVFAIIGGASARHHLYYPCNDVTAARIAELTAPVLDDEVASDTDGNDVAIDGVDDPKIEAMKLNMKTKIRRQYKVEWRGLNGLVEAAVVDRTKHVVMRDSVGPVNEKDVIVDKPLMEAG